MSHEAVRGTVLNQIAQSNVRWPKHRVLLHNPRCTTPTHVATDTFTIPPLDITAFVESLKYDENMGHENLDNPSSTKISLVLRRHPTSGQVIRRGLIEDGVIVQVFTGDVTVAPEDWTCIFTGTFRGRPGDDPGTPADSSEGLTATAFGREERFLNLEVTTDPFPADTDLGAMAFHVAQEKMGLTMDEILFGALGFESKHFTNQLVEMKALNALYQLGFPVGKKPKFDARGRLRFVDVDLDKPAARLYTNRALFRSIKSTPNEIEVNNSVVIRGLSAILTKAKGEVQLIDTFEAITGFFDDVFREDKYYSQDHSQRAEDTYLVTKHAISWSRAVWEEVDEFHGRVDIDCHTLFAARLIIFVTFLVSEMTIAAIDLLYQESGGITTSFFDLASGDSIPELRFSLKVLSQIALAGLLWSMQFIGRGSYEIWGAPFEFVYQELMVRMKMIGLDKSELREIEFRNDFISDTETCQAVAYRQLRREMLKNQTVTIEMMDDPLLETDDIIDVCGLRFYITGISRDLRANAAPVMTLTCWLIWRDVLKEARAAAVPRSQDIGYGHGYARRYGREL